MNNPLKICLVMQGGRDWIGGTEYIKNIILSLGSLPTEMRSTFKLYLILKDPLDNEVSSIVDEHVDHKFFCINESTSSSFLHKAKSKFSSNVFLMKERIDFVYPYFSRTNLKKSFRFASWIPDFQHKHLTHFFTPQEIQARDKAFSSMAKCSPNIVLSSKTARADLYNFFPNTKAKTFIFPFHTYPCLNWYAQDPKQAQKKYNLPDRFFIISNQFWQHKNHMMVLDALKLLQEKNIYPVVVCTGHIYDSRRPDYSDAILNMIHELGLASQFLLLGLIPKIDQVLLVRHSLAVIQPSLFEGWSTVVENARCLGKSLILTDLPVHKEQSPPHSIFFERDSVESLANILEKQWKCLSPGPNIRQETEAKAQAFRLSQVSGETFLKIAHACVGNLVD